MNIGDKRKRRPSDDPRQNPGIRAPRAHLRGRAPVNAVAIWKSAHPEWRPLPEQPASGVFLDDIEWMRWLLNGGPCELL